MKVLNSAFTALVSLLVLGACTTTEDVERWRTDIAEAVTKYSDQLVATSQPHAFISGQPRAVDPQLVRSPYTVQSINGRNLAWPEYSFVKARPLPRDLAFSALKVPVGNHDIVVHGGYSRSKQTSFKNVKFVDKARYVIVEGKTKDNDIEIFIAEYKPDIRFLPSEPEFYLVGNPITPRVRLGATSP